MIPLLEPLLADFKAGTIGWIIQRYIDKMSDRGMRHLGVSHLSALRRLQRASISSKTASTLKKGQVIDFCESRRQTVAASTVLQDLTFIGGAIKYAVARWDDCEAATAALQAIDAAKPTLMQQQIIGKGRPRDRRPTYGEWQMLIDYFHEYEKRARAKLPMAEIQEFQVWSARRISETCRIKCIDVNREKRTVIVRDMKDPKQKKGNDVEVPLLGRAWEIVERRMRSWDGKNDQTRVFEVNHKSAGAAFTIAKKVLGITNLHLHDLRREAASRLFEAGYDVQEVMLVTGHKNPQMLLRVYTKLKPEDLHKGPAKMRGLQPDSTFVVDHRRSLEIELTHAVPTPEPRASR